VKGCLRHKQGHTDTMKHNDHWYKHTERDETQTHTCISVTFAQQCKSLASGFSPQTRVIIHRDFNERRIWTHTDLSPYENFKMGFIYSSSFTENPWKTRL